eukprot:CAMPEP_0195112958 /NCGR_PEP_ID=MMETSP0448-20130528/100809_1 /TAXON_ID=66468 /ORGANISM="Heterocapsa triquestra, Strain CCMP 448" /LENGTH=46 /DNA_ID= /DNA_START= /DNA_END= /DNA_ORIENTATION=
MTGLEEAVQFKSDAHLAAQRTLEHEGMPTSGCAMRTYSNSGATAEP